MDIEVFSVINKKELIKHMDEFENLKKENIELKKQIENNKIDNLNQKIDELNKKFDKLNCDNEYLKKLILNNSNYFHTI